MIGQKYRDIDAELWFMHVNFNLCILIEICARYLEFMHFKSNLCTLNEIYAF